MQNIYLKYLLKFSGPIGRISLGLQNEFEWSMVNEPSVFELLRFYFSEMHKITNTMMKPCNGLNGDLMPEHKKTTNMTTMALITAI